MELEKLRECVREALIMGHKALKEALSKNQKEIKGRGSFGDISYDFDKIAERAIIESITSHLDGVYIISEEAGFIPSENPKYYVVIDPVDGSTNAFYGIPFYASSILISSSAKMEDALVAGVIDHSNQDIFLGDKESGVSINGHTASLRDSVPLRSALIQMNLDALRSDGNEALRRWAERIIERVRHLRNFSAASLEACYLLDGRADAYVCLTPNLKIMDLCASVALLEWAGGAYRILGGKPSLLNTQKFGMIAASSWSLLEEIYSLREGDGD